jgi:hypothetical protein
MADRTVQPANDQPFTVDCAMLEWARGELARIASVVVVAPPHRGDTVLYSGEHELVATRGHGANLTATVAVQAGANGALVDTLM